MVLKEDEWMKVKSVFSLSASFRRWSLEEEAIAEMVNRVSLQTALTEGNFDGKATARTVLPSNLPTQTSGLLSHFFGCVDGVFKRISGCQRRRDVSANEHSAFRGDGVFKPFLVSVLHRIVALFKRLWNWQISTAMHENCPKGSLWCAFALPQPVNLGWPGKPRYKGKRSLIWQSHCFACGKVAGVWNCFNFTRITWKARENA